MARSNQVRWAAVGATLALICPVLSSPLPADLRSPIDHLSDHNHAATIPFAAIGGITLFGFGRSKSTDSESDADRIKRLEGQNAKLSNQLKEARNDIANLNSELEIFRKIQTASLKRFQTLFQELPLPCFTVNEVGNIMEWNRASESFFGLQPHQVVDQPLSYVLGEDVYRGHAQETIYQVFLGHQPDPANVRVKPRNGETRTVKWFVSPVKDSEGRIVGAVNTLGVVPSRDSAKRLNHENRAA